MSQLRPSTSTSRLPAQRSPWRRAGGSARAADLAQAIRVEALERRRCARGGQRPAVAGETGERRQPLRRVELRPGVARLVRQTAATGGAAVLAPEGARRRPVERGQRAPEVGLGARPRLALLDPAEHEERGLGALAVGHRQHLRQRRPTPGSASHRSPAASVVKNPAGGDGCVLANTARPSSSSSRNAWATSPPRTTSARRTAAPERVPDGGGPARRRSSLPQDGLDLGGGDEQPVIVVDDVGAHRDELPAGVDDR